MSASQAWPSACSAGADRDTTADGAVTTQELASTGHRGWTKAQLTLHLMEYWVVALVD